MTKTQIDCFLEELESVSKKSFPKSFVKAVFLTNLGPVVRVIFRLVDDINLLPNRIVENDPAYSIFFIHLDNRHKDGSLPDNMTIDISQAGARLYTNPEPGTNYAMGSVKLGWRKKTGNEASILKHFDAYMKKSKIIMQQHQDNLYGSAEQTAIYKDRINA